MTKTFKSDVGREFIKMAKDQLGIQVITPVYFGSRSVNLKPDKLIKTPADMAGIKLRMPPGEFWQFLGESLGANPTPVAYAELYTALQTGTVDGQDNPVVASKLMKFDEVTTQFVLTRHVIAYDVMAIRSKIWDAMKPDQQAKFQAAADKAMAENTKQNSTRRKRKSSSTSRRKARRSTSRIRTRSARSRRSDTSTNTATTGRRARSSGSTPSNSAYARLSCQRSSAGCRWPHGPRNGSPHVHLFD